MAMASLMLPRCLPGQCRPSSMDIFLPRPASLRLLPPSKLRCRAYFSWDDDPHPHLPVPEFTEPVALVTGASRGIGLEFTRQLLTKYPGCIVYGTARSPFTSEGLLKLKVRHKVRLELGTLDVTKDETVIALANEIGEKYGRLDLIINCAGVLHIPNVLQPEVTVSDVDPEKLMIPFEVNALGPTIVAKYMWELLKTGRGYGTGRAGAVIASICPKISSIKDNEMAGWYGYRASKTGLNMMTKTMAMEALRRKDPILFCLLHPGTVNTELSRPFAPSVPNLKIFSTDYAVERLLGIINKVRSEDTGKFTAWDRQEVPW